MSRNLFVSVIIPVFNDADRLKLCLAALDQQTYDSNHYEVIVVDNGSEDLAAVKAVVTPYLKVTLLTELTPGSYAARNKGIALAKGEVIAFTDADCIPDPHWIERGVAHLTQTPNCGQVVGKVNLFFADPEHPTPVELYESLTAFPQEQLLRDAHAGATANVLTWKQVIEKVGPFNASLMSYGDLEWGGRVFQAGYQQVYGSDVEVSHPARRSFRELYQRTLRIAGGVYEGFIKPEDSFIQRQKIFARLLWDDLVPPVNFVINTFQHSHLSSWQHKLQASLVMVYVRYVGLIEKIRLKLGGSPHRA